MGFKASSAKRMAASSAVAGTIVVIPSTDGTGPTLSGGGITAATVVKTQVVSVGATTAAATTVASGLKITNVYVADSSFNVLDDTALSPSGGYLKIVGTGFNSGCVAYINGSSLTTTYVSSTEIHVTVPASSVGTYSLMIFNTDGNGAIYLNLGVSNFPTFTTSAGSLGSIYETSSFTQSVSASGDSPFTYSLYSGSLPPGATLNTNGTISGTSQAESGSSTYSFVINVKDAQGQDTQRSFSLTINTDVVTWSSPSNNQAYSLTGGAAMAGVTLSATSAAGYSVSYSANTLPTGVTLSGGTISGTPSTAQTVYTQLTATAATTGRSATRNVSWTVSFGDTYFNYTTLLLNADNGGNVVNGANNNTFLDSSTNNATVTRGVTPTQGSFSPFSATGWSNYFGGDGNYLSVPSNVAFNMGTNNFTIEFWYYPTSFQNYNVIVAQNNGATNAGSNWDIFITSTGAVLFEAYTGSTAITTTSSALTLNTWSHVACVRNGSSFTVYINGTASGTPASNAGSLNSNALTVYIGRLDNTGTSRGISGYISNLRIVNGTAVYTTTFTPSTSPLTAIANTQLLTCQSNRFIDKSTNAFAVSVSGTPSVQAFSPFAPGVSYSAATHGGSGYFNGTADYLTLPASSNWDFGSGSFTIECWIYPTANATQQVYAFHGWSGSGAFNYGWQCQINTSNQLVFYANGTLQAFTDLVLAMNQWTHVAFVGSGGVLSAYKNGVKSSTTLSYTSIVDRPTATLVLGGWNNNNEQIAERLMYAGYISDFRVLKGTALYSSTFTPPTAPLTAISNTQALFNFTNGGIIDAHSSNDMQTVGSTQISTSVKKYGTGSISFNGSTDYLAFKPGPNPNFAMGSGDWTIEMWMYPTSSAATQLFFDVYDGNSSGRLTLQLNTSRTIGLYGASGASRTVSTGTVTLNQWQHVAFCKSGGSTRIFINGTQVNTTYSDAVTYTCTTGVVYLGANGTNGGNNFSGYLDDVRITKGYARYTSNFTAPSSAFMTQ